MTTVEQLARKIQEKYRTFGGGKLIPGNPIAHALKDASPQFAAGVDIEDVITTIIEEYDKITTLIERGRP